MGIPTTTIVKDGEEMVVNTVDVAKWAAEGWAPKGAPPAREPVLPVKPLEEHDVPGLKELAGKNSVELPQTESKEEIVKAIRDAGIDFTPPEGATTGSEGGSNEPPKDEGSTQSGEGGAGGATGSGDQDKKTE